MRTVYIFLFTAAMVSNMGVANAEPRTGINWESLIPEQRVAHYAVSPDTEVSELVVKFREGTGVRLRNGSLLSASKQPLPPDLSANEHAADLDEVERIAQTNGQRIVRTFASFKEDELDSLKKAGEQESGTVLEDLNLYHAIALQPGTRYRNVEAIVRRLNKLKSVELAYAQTKPQPASHLSTPNFISYQGYLEDPPNGINATWALNQRGGTGMGVRIVDVEGSWRVTHEDFPALFYDSGNHINELSRRNHGTAVVGILAARDNGIGMRGIVPSAQIGVQSYSFSNNGADAIVRAATQAGRNGVVVLEMHAAGPGDSSPCSCTTSTCNYLPLEYWSAYFAAIQTAVANGVNVVEAGGNGSVNLDDPVYAGAFDRGLRDSGAILVGAGRAAAREPLCFTNFGTRIDMHGWGNDVATLGYGVLFTGDHADEDQFYTTAFGGTSSASPIVAGAVASVQGIALSNGLTPLRPLEMRALLSTTGTPQAYNLANNIGPLPNIKAAAESMLGIAPNNLSWLPAIFSLIVE